MYIVVEGIDTCGKSTQIQLLESVFAEAIITKEPGATNLGSKIRELVLYSDDLCPVTELLLFLADRSNHASSVIKPNLGKLIISDRSLISGMAYALASKKFDFKWLETLNRFAMQDIMPDAIILFKINVKTLKERLGSKSNDIIESRGIEYMLDVQNHLELVSKKLKIPTLIINAQDSIEEIHAQITKFILEKRAL
ncbi:dTMP kinase [Sulfurimonas sp. MAG313]|nr:dTMP kinase [Sulfurimonas sp. MAG313]MDF1882130.1 dTMP kinase [Sulfurimonas sp. MAG313]